MVGVVIGRSVLLVSLPLPRRKEIDLRSLPEQRLAKRREEPVKCFSLVTEILGGPQAETVNVRKEKWEPNSNHSGFPPLFYLRERSCSICKVERTRQETAGLCRNF